MARRLDRLIAEMKTIFSMSRKRNGWDNALMESGFNRLKNERVFHRHESREAAKADLFDYIEVFYAPNEAYSARLIRKIFL